MKNALISETYYIENDRYDQLKLVTHDLFKQFCQDLVSELYVLCLAHGNVHHSAVLQLHHDVLRVLDFKPFGYLKDVPDVWKFLEASTIPLPDNFTSIINLFCTS